MSADGSQPNLQLAPAGPTLQPPSILPFVQLAHRIYGNNDHLSSHSAPIPNSHCIPACSPFIKLMQVELTVHGTMEETRDLPETATAVSPDDDIYKVKRLFVVGEGFKRNVSFLSNINHGED